MYKYSFGKKPVLENAQKITVSVFVRHTILELKDHLREQLKYHLDLNNEEHVKLYISMAEKYVKVNLRQENNGEIDFTSTQNPVKITYTRSNLGRGFIFWFICNRCGKRVRDLFFPYNSEVWACRTCHRLSYRKQRLNYSKHPHYF